MLQTLGGRHPAAAVLHQEVRDEVLDRSTGCSDWSSTFVFTLAFADIGSNSGSSKSKITLR